jgi:predicted MFS family arabinose efflux permease
MIEAVFVPGDRAKAIGAWAGLGGVAFAVGPLVGGWLVAAASWRLVFLINVPLAALVLIAARHVPETNDPNAAVKSDIAGAIAAALGLGAVTYALIESAQPIAKLAGLVGAGCLVAFIVIEHRSPHPMMPLTLFRNATFSVLNGLTFVVYAALSGASFLLSVELQQVLGYSPIEAGAALVPTTLMLLAFASRSGELASRRGPRLQLTLGPFVIAIAHWAMTRINPGTHYLTGVLPQVILFGLGLVMMVSPLTASVLAAVEDAHAGIASGVNNAVARLGGLLAIATLPALAGIHREDYVHPAAFNTEFHRAMLITATLAALGGLVALVGLPRKPLL